MTTDNTRDLTETELEYLGWEFFPTLDLPGGSHWIARLNHVYITEGDKEYCVELANRIARAQGIAPPTFAVGDRVVIQSPEDETGWQNATGTIIAMEVTPYQHWEHTVKFDEIQYSEDDDDQEPYEEWFFWDKELERLPE